MSAARNQYAIGLDKTPANYVPLTPLTFIERSAYIYPERVAVIHGARRYTWRESYVRCRRLASALKQLGIGKGDTVAAILNNTPEMFECHFGVPACGAVLNTINTRLDAEAVAFILNHAEARVLITDREYSRMVKKAVEYPEGEDRKHLISLIANQMKKCFINWNKDSVEDQKILDDLREYSQGAISLSPEDLQLCGQRTYVQRRPQQNNGQRRMQQNNNQRRKY